VIKLCFIRGRVDPFLRFGGILHNLTRNVIPQDPAVMLPIYVSVLGGSPKVLYTVPPRGAWLCVALNRVSSANG